MNRLDNKIADITMDRIILSEIFNFQNKTLTNSNHSNFKNTIQNLPSINRHLAFQKKNKTPGKVSIYFKHSGNCGKVSFLILRLCFETLICILIFLLER